MANLQKQIDALTAYFQADCARPGVLPIALTIEHFITRLDGTPVDYAQLAQVIYSMQGHDEPLREDNVYLGFRCPSYTITIQAGCQVTISLAPYPTVLQAMAVYEGCFTRLCNALAANNMYARTVGGSSIPPGGASAVGTAERLYDHGPLFPQYRQSGWSHAAGHRFHPRYYPLHQRS